MEDLLSGAGTAIVYQPDGVLLVNGVRRAWLDGDDRRRWWRVVVGDRHFDVDCVPRWRGWTAALVDQESRSVECKWVPSLVGRGGSVEGVAGRLTVRGALLRPNRLRLTLSGARFDVTVERVGLETVSPAREGWVTFSGRQAVRVRVLAVDSPTVSSAWISHVALLCWVLVTKRQETPDAQMHPGAGGW